ncbi:MAG: hypothetical protein ACOC0Q_09040 [Wenzhouxiangella sp.]
MTDNEVLMQEAVEILQAGDDQGLTAQEIYHESRLAMSLAEMTGALNRLRNQKQICRGTDKRWRTINQAERSSADREARVTAAAKAVAAERAKRDQPPAPSAAPKPKPEAKPDPKPKPERRDISPAEALDAVARVARKDNERRLQLHEREGRLAWLIRDLEAEADAAQVRLDRYVRDLDDDILEHLVEMTLAATRALEAARSQQP